MNSDQAALPLTVLSFVTGVLDPGCSQCVCWHQMQGLSALGFANVSYPLSKLGQGWGQEVCATLDGLLDVTLQHRGIVLGRPSYSVDR
jgi:hypothetical protein